LAFGAQPSGSNRPLQQKDPKSENPTKAASRSSFSLLPVLTGGISDESFLKHPSAPSGMKTETLTALGPETCPFWVARTNALAVIRPAAGRRFARKNSATAAQVEKNGC